MQHKSSLSTIMVGRDISAGFAAYVKVGMEEILVLVLRRKAAIRFGRKASTTVGTKDAKFVIVWETDHEFCCVRHDTEFLNNNREFVNKNHCKLLFFGMGVFGTEETRLQLGCCTECCGHLV